MSRNPTRRTLLWLLALCLLLSACGLFAGRWPGPVPIDPELWDIEIDVCGEVEGFDIKWVEGRIINTTGERSPFYDVAYTVTYSDGTTVSVDGNTSVAPIPAGESREFSVNLIESRGKDVVTCDVVVTDSVENYS